MYRLTDGELLSVIRTGSPQSRRAAYEELRWRGWTPEFIAFHFPKNNR